MAEWHGFYYAVQVARIAQIPIRTLYDWKSRGIIAPSIHVMHDDLEVIDGYSYAEKRDEWDTTAATQFGQKVETRVFGDFFQELRRHEQEGDLLVPPDYRMAVEINPDVMGGQPIVRGTRVPTSILAMLRKQGKSIRELARLYFTIPQQTIQMAIEYEEFLDLPTAKAGTPVP